MVVLEGAPRESASGGDLQGMCLKMAEFIGLQADGISAPLPSSRPGSAGCCIDAAWRLG